MTTSTINPALPAEDSALASSVVRGNFAAAYSDVNSLWSSTFLSSISLDATYSQVNYMDLHGNDSLKPCTFPTPYSAITSEVTHPAVLYVPNGWNGWKYVCAYTPYPNTDEDYGNPCLAVSNDGITWELPSASTPNPLMANVYVNGHNSDTACAIGPDGYLYIIWRWKERSTGSAYPAGSEGIIWTKTLDGITFSTYTILLSTDTATHAFFAPTFFWNGDQWEMYIVDITTTHVQRAVFDSFDSTLSISAFSNVSGIYNSNDSRWWHCEVKMVNGGKRVMLMYETGPSSTSYAIDKGSLTIYESIDGGTNWYGTNVIKGSAAGNYYYKSSFCSVYGTVQMWVSVNGTQSKDSWYISKWSLGEGQRNIRNTELNKINSGISSTLSDYLLADNCIRANDAVSATSPNKGSAYVAQLGTWGISSNQLYHAAAANSQLVNDLSYADHDFSMVVNTTPGNECWLWCRTTDGNNFVRFGNNMTTGTGLKVEIYTSSTLRESYAFAGSVAAGDIMRAVCIGKTMMFYVNENLLLKCATSLQSTATKVGIQSSNNANRFKNLIAVKAR